MRTTLTSSELRPWWRRVGPWAGIATSPVALMTGGGIAESNAQAQLLVAVVCGVGLLTLLAATQGLLGTRRRAGFSEVAAASLGSRGARLVASPVIALMMAGWCGFNVSIAGAGLGKLFGVGPRIGVLLFAAAMLTIAWHGLDTLSLAALVAGGATVVLAIVGVRLALRDHSGSLLGDTVESQWIGVLPAVALVVGYGAAFALRTPDFTHDLRRERDVWWCALVGLALPLCAFLVVGALLQHATGTWNLVTVLERVGSPAIAYAFLAIGFSGSVLSNLHSGAVAVQDIAPRLSHRAGLVTTALIGTGLALADYSDQMIPFLTAMALAAPCLIAVLWMDSRRNIVTQLPIRHAAIAAWAIGGLVGAVLAVVWRPGALAAGLLVGALAMLTLRTAGVQTRAK